MILIKKVKKSIKHVLKKDTCFENKNDTRLILINTGKNEKRKLK